MSRWDDIEGRADGRKYAEQFARLAASGADVHGEAQFCAALVEPPARVLDAGCGTGRVAIRLAELGYKCMGVDTDASMLAEARRAAPEITWLQADLATLDLGADSLFDLIVAAGNVIPLVAPGTEREVVIHLSAHLHPTGFLVAGFGLDPAHLPLDDASVTLQDYDSMCASAGLELAERFATWDAHPYVEGGGYAVSVHRRARI